MDEIGASGGLGGHWWWAVASTAQLALGMNSYRKGYSGDSRFMPFKAFAVASLFVGASASAAVASLRASGIHSECTLGMPPAGANSVVPCLELEALPRLKL
ncbi:unnamed protein product [Thlaspi arvense]|uniref:Uncharacterized protein n=1 Tax=Thlaspi arvense TaxID=13288 RepID=A0AAU9RFM1_THLAR|nr:unnamed protein product [Thlaspi arvense]